MKFSDGQMDVLTCICYREAALQKTDLFNKKNWKYLTKQKDKHWQ